MKKSTFVLLFVVMFALMGILLFKSVFYQPNQDGSAIVDKSDALLKKYEQGSKVSQRDYKNDMNEINKQEINDLKRKLKDMDEMVDAMKSLREMLEKARDREKRLKERNSELENNLEETKKKAEGNEKQTGELVTHQEENKEKDDFLKDPQGRYMDFLISVRYIHCSVKLSVIRINEIFNPKRIIFLSYSKDDCVLLRGFATNVHCIWEKEILPKFDPGRFGEIVDEEVKRTGDKRLITANPSYPGDVGSFKDRAGWYFLQMLNIGAARYMKDLSENYVVWDSDIVPLTKEMKFFNDKGQIIRYTQAGHASFIAKGYHESYEKLTGKKVIHPDGNVVNPNRGTQTWVAHQMVFTKSVVERYIQAIEKHRGVEKDLWPEEIVKVAMSIKGSEEFAYADYDHYGSFAYEEDPTLYDVRMGSYSKFSRPTRPDNYKSKTCCIPKSVLDRETKRGLHYIVNEIHKGDVPTCRSLSYYGLYHRDLPISWLDDVDIMSTLTT